MCSQLHHILSRILGDVYFVVVWLAAGRVGTRAGPAAFSLSPPLSLSPLCHAGCLPTPCRLHPRQLDISETEYWASFPGLSQILWHDGVQIPDAVVEVSGQTDVRLFRFTRKMGRTHAVYTHLHCDCLHDMRETRRATNQNWRGRWKLVGRVGMVGGMQPCLGCGGSGRTVRSCRTYRLT